MPTLKKVTRRDALARGRKQAREWNAANPEKHRDNNHKWYAANREREREKSRKRHAANSGMIAERKRKQYETNPEKHRKRGREWYAANLEKCKKSASKRYAANPEKYRGIANKWRRANLEKSSTQARRHNRTPIGRLRAMCRQTTFALETGVLDHSRFDLLYYGPKEFIAHLESTLPEGMVFKQARATGYQVDHVVPLSFISKMLPMNEAGRLLAFRVSSDLMNLRMIPGSENMSKSATMSTPEQFILLNKLCKKYGVTDDQD